MVIRRAIGAASGGVSWAALRLRTRAVWPLVVLHAVDDLLLQLSSLPIPQVDGVLDILLLVYGLALLPDPLHTSVHPSQYPPPYAGPHEPM